MNPKENLS